MTKITRSITFSKHSFARSHFGKGHKKLVMLDTHFFIGYACCYPRFFGKLIDSDRKLMAKIGGV